MTRAVISQLTGIKTDDMHGTLIEKYGKQQGKVCNRQLFFRLHDNVYVLTAVIARRSKMWWP